MLKKLQNKKGFTLMEMLIVVAIIAVLVAIAIPVFNGALTKSKEAADVANVRATYAEWQTAILTENKTAPAAVDGPPSGGGAPAGAGTAAPGGLPPPAAAGWPVYPDRRPDSHIPLCWVVSSVVP